MGTIDCPNYIESCQLYVTPGSKSKDSNIPCSENPHLFLTLTPEVFDLVREKFGSAKNVGRELPRELPKAWTYLNEAWNTIARTPITSVIESVTGGDAKSYHVDLLSDGTK